LSATNAACESRAIGFSFELCPVYDLGRIITPSAMNPE
jgi:hypothetical protein